MQNMNKKQGGFTLLELLVVVGIMAVLGGAMISSFGGQEQKAARGAATQTIAGVEDALRIYKAVNDVLPADLESLACLPQTGVDFSTLAVNNGPSTGLGADIELNQAYKFGGQTNAAGFGGGLGKKVADKFDLISLTTEASQALTDAGITTLRYADTAACDNPDAESNTATEATQGSNTAAGDLVDMDIPAHAFENFRAGTDKNRGRGFSQPLVAGAPVMVWKAGPDGYNNTKLGAGATDVLVGLGIGQASDLVGGPDSPFAKAPFYGQVGKDKYNHFIALVNIGTTADDAAGNVLDMDDATNGVTALTEGAAYVQAVVDPRGDFLDEEMAEFTGQKK
jgi:prepilin-type N-terminal cleavage/methylation domain-containing protein